MLISLAEAAALLHKSERQLRYMMQLGTLHAIKVGNRWMIQRDQLPQDGRAIEAEARRVDQVGAAASEAVRLVGAPAPAADRVVDDVLRGQPPPGARFSVRSLQAWRVIEPTHAELVEKLGATAEPVVALRRALRQLAHGCHRFFREDKANAYRAARDDVSDAVFALLADHVEGCDDVVDRLENDALAALTGLLRRYDNRRPG